jgi:hypothetical protein
MALHWDVRKVKNNDSVCFVEWEKGGKVMRKPKPKTEALIWMSMRHGFSEITEANWEKVYERCFLLEMESGGPWCYEVNENGETVETPITPEDVYRHIGLVTNVAPVTDAAFAKSVMRALREQAAKKASEFKKEVS